MGDDFIKEQDSTEGVNITVTTAHLADHDDDADPLLEKVPSDSMVRDVITNYMAGQRRGGSAKQHVTHDHVPKRRQPLNNALGPFGELDSPAAAASESKAASFKPDKRQALSSHPSAQSSSRKQTPTSTVVDRIRKDPRLSNLPRKTIVKIRRDLDSFDVDSEVTFVRILDCGGQLSFSMVQSVCFNEMDSVHVVAFNASHDLDERKPKEYFRRGGEDVEVVNSLPMSHIDYIVHWLSSITIVTAPGQTKTATKPVVILLGSHIDLISDASARCKIVKDRLWSRIRESDLDKKLDLHGPFFVDNRRVDQPSSGSPSEMPAVQKELRQLITKNSPATSVPLSWMKVEMIISRLQRTETCLSFEDFSRLVSYVITDSIQQDVKALVKHLHKTGAVRFFPRSGHPGADDWVFLNTEWLVTEITKILAFTMKNTDTPVHLKRDAEQLRKHGLLSRDLLHHIWLGHGATLEGAILHVMELFGLQCPLNASLYLDSECSPDVDQQPTAAGDGRARSDSAEGGAERYWIPSCLAPKTGGLPSPSGKSKAKNIPRLLLSTDGQVCPPFVFQRVVVYLLQHYKPEDRILFMAFDAIRFECTPPTLTSGQRRRQHYTADVTYSDQGIVVSLRVSLRVARGEVKSATSVEDVALHMLKSISSAVQRIASTGCPGLTIRLAYECPECLPGESNWVMASTLPIEDFDEERDELVEEEFQCRKCERLTVVSKLWLVWLGAAYAPEVSLLCKIF